MSDQELQRLNEKLLRFAGFRRREDLPILVYKGDKDWIDPDGDYLPEGALPNFLDPIWGIAHQQEWVWPKAHICGITFRFYPGGTKCEITYEDEAGFDTVTSWVQAESSQADYNGEAFRLSAIAAAKAVEQLIEKEGK